MRGIKVSCYRSQYPYAQNTCDYDCKQRGVCRHFTKNEDTWCKMLGHYNAEYDTALRIF